MTSSFSEPIAQRRVGLEIELLAPSGRGRSDLAELLARMTGGSVRPAFHYDSEISLHPEVSVFHNLSPALEVVGDSGELVATLRDDSSIVEDLRGTRAVGGLTGTGPMRVVSDDRRLLRLLASQFDSARFNPDAVVRAASALDLIVVDLDDERLKLHDRDGETVALTGPIPAARGRVAEVVSPPLTRDNLRPWLDLIAEAASRERCTVPVEGATHLHFDAEPFGRPDRFGRLVEWFDVHFDKLRQHYQTNERCRTLGPFDRAFVELSRNVGTRCDVSSWQAVKEDLFRLHRTGFGDVNLVGVLHPVPPKPTIELRFLPVSMDLRAVEKWALELGGVLDGLAAGRWSDGSADDLSLDAVLGEARRLDSLGPSA